MPLIKEYKLIRFEKAKAKNKKYSAIIQNKKTGKEKKINFGDKRYQHYKDKTGLNIFSHLDHLDKERRRLYIARHRGFLKSGVFSPAYFSYNYLW